MRRAFTLVEGLLALGIIGVITGVTMPMYHEYQIHSDLSLATEQAVQGLRRAKIIAQSGQDSSPWGFYVPGGVLYKGQSYATRDPAFDEMYPMPSTITVEGLYEVSYDRVTGAPSAIGTITLISLSRERRSIVIDVEPEGITTMTSDQISICHYPPGNPGNMHTISIVDSAWPAHQAHGDTYGPCTTENPASSSSASSAATTSSSSLSSSAQTSSGMPASSSFASSAGGGGEGGGSCSRLFSVASTGMITTLAIVDLNPAVVASLITYGAGGPSIDVEVKKSTNGGNTYSSMLTYANVKNLDTTGHTLSNLATGTNIAFKPHAYYKKRGWLTYDRSYTTIEGTGQIRYLKNGDPVPNYAPFGGQSPLQTLLKNKGFADAQNIVTIPATSLLLIGELGTTATSGSADFQDIVLLLSFTLKGGCP